MKDILTQYKDKINGTFSFFDRMIITGHLRSFFNAMLYFLSCQNVLLKDYGSYAQGITDGIKAHVQKYTDSQSRPLVYLNSPKTSKEQTALKCLEDSPVTEGLVCTSQRLRCAMLFPLYQIKQPINLK